MDDPYLDLIDENWNNIAMMYDSFQDKKPIVIYEVDSKKIYSVSGDEYVDSLTIRTRAKTKKLYEEACNNNEFILFIRDEKKQRLRSYIFDIPERE